MTNLFFQALLVVGKQLAIDELPLLVELGLAIVSLATTGLDILADASMSLQQKEDNWSNEWDSLKLVLDRCIQEGQALPGELFGLLTNVAGTEVKAALGIS